MLLSVQITLRPRTPLLTEPWSSPNALMYGYLPGPKQRFLRNKILKKEQEKYNEKVSKY